MMLLQAENDMNTTEDVPSSSSCYQLAHNNNFQNNSNINILNTSNIEDGFISSLRAWNTDSTNTGSLTEDPFTSMQGSSSNILVTVRVRPESTREKAERKSSSIVRVVDRNVLVFDPSDSAQGSQQQRRALGLRRGKELRFAFDRVFDETATQLEVYENSAKALLESVLDGYNATVFAYGATGAGKTFTMFGSEISGPGILPLTIIDIFRMMEKRKHEKTYRVTVSFLEVYNENIHDLLVPQNGKAVNHEIREDKTKGIVVSGLSEHECHNADHALELIQRGISNRTQFGTAANAQSSRSHAVFQINVQQTDRTANIQADVGVGKLSLIDLAGSERASVTKNRGARLVEGANINKSLLALANCINALGKNKGKGYVPYRNSKLTRLLKDSLGGNCKTVMIANLSPSDLCYDDTYNTLKYANRAKNIKTIVKKNIHNVNFHITKYLKIIDELRIEVQELKIQLQTKEHELSTNSQQQNEQYEKERESTEELRSSLSTVFQEQMTNRRILLELEEQDRQNSLQIMSIKNEIERWCREHPGEEKPLRIHTRQKDADTLILAKREYISKKEEIEHHLQENISCAKSIQDHVPKIIGNNELRQLLDLQVKVHDQEILNLDLERMIDHHKSKAQRMALILEDAQYCSSKAHDVMQDMYDRLKETNSLTPELERAYMMACSLLDVVEKQHHAFHEGNHQNATSVGTTNASCLPLEADYDAMVEDALKTPKNIHTGAKKRRSSSTTQFSSLFQLSFPNVPTEDKKVITPEEYAQQAQSKLTRARRQQKTVSNPTSVRQNNSNDRSYNGKKQPLINNYLMEEAPSVDTTMASDSGSDKSISPPLSPQMSNLSLVDNHSHLQQQQQQNTVVLTPEDEDLVMEDMNDGEDHHNNSQLFKKVGGTTHGYSFNPTYPSPSKRNIHTSNQVSSSSSSLDPHAHRHFSPLKKSAVEDINALKEKFEKFRTDYLETKHVEQSKLRRVLKKTTSPSKSQPEQSHTNPPLSPNQLKGTKARKFDDTTNGVPSTAKRKTKKVKFEGDSPTSPKPVPSYMAYTQSAQHRIGATTASRRKPSILPVSFAADNDWILALRSNKENALQSSSNSTSVMVGGGGAAVPFHHNPHSTPSTLKLMRRIVPTHSFPGTSSSTSATTTTAHHHVPTTSNHVGTAMISSIPLPSTQQQVTIPHKDFLPTSPRGATIR
ncbi:hypothetical protein C9374_007254 [Naegleria lovaniensis]|uniref:Kinesin-like protein KIN-8B n=1 Tax=Naegleria lovaniensis TaxID=51637 RepID=A0AA88GZ70_NAELO|nr:uncharacterized protein C9374_007254 [Naegleria lovaniensis]KAG2393723.1 hypothetical protein C9374_007254 [Naegleria lovaniensis]